jgi:hypothetical protein
LMLFLPARIRDSASSVTHNQKVSNPKLPKQRQKSA